MQRFAPKEKADLAVNKKKVEEVEQWLEENLHNPKKDVPMLLLCGPAGCGKTATIQCLAAGMCCRIQEWTTPVSLTTFNRMEPGFGSRPEFFEDGQIERFEDFLFRTDRYGSLLSAASTSKKIILIEDVPNIFMRDPAEFHSFLRRYKQMGRTPAVFIVSESSDNMEFRLFPREFLGELSIRKITFNPVAPTLLNKSLRKVLDEAQVVLGVQLPSPDDVEQIAAASKGDIRSAVNALEFACADPTGKGESLPVRPSAKKKKWGTKKANKGMTLDGCGSKSSPSIVERDTALQLFHSLGKILYCKREELDKMNEHDRLPEHMKDFERPPPLEVPEAVFERTAVSEELFILFLHHNAAHFYTDTETAFSCSDWFSQSDVLQSEWSSDNQMASYALSLATRGVMFDLKRPEGTRGWRPLEKPQWNVTSRSVKQKIYELKSIFRGWCSTGLDLQLDLVPFLPQLQPLGFGPGKLDIANEVGRIRNAIRRPHDMLSERDCVQEVQEDPEPIRMPEGATQKIVELSDDEVVIEDFDD